MKLLEKMSSKDNNFDFLRFVAASLVIFSHTFPLSGASGREPLYRLTKSIHFGGLAVSIFFIISGFLITRSWSEKPDIILYFKKRILRIMPALIASTFFCVLIVGPLVTTVTLNEYFLTPDTYKFVKNIFLYPVRYNLPGAFAGNPYPNAVNGSIWSLPIEFFAYCLTAALGVLGIISRRKLLVVFLLCLIFVDLHLLNRPSEFLHMPAIETVKYLIYFFIGSVIYTYREKIPLDGNVVTLVLLLFIISFRTIYVDLMLYIALPYTVLYVAYMDIPVLKNFGRYGDFSYGIYIYGFPVQQTVMHLYDGHLNRSIFFIFSYTVTLFIAILSWHFVEKPFLRLKKMPVFGLEMPLFLKRMAPFAQRM